MYFSRAWARRAYQSGEYALLPTACYALRSTRSRTPRDFDAPDPAPYDASAATVAACGLLHLVKWLHGRHDACAMLYLARATRLIADTLKVCAAPAAALSADGSVQWGEGGWETLLKHSTIAGNVKANRRLMDHGLICEREGGNESNMG